LLIWTLKRGTDKINNKNSEINVFIIYVSGLPRKPRASRLTYSSIYKLIVSGCLPLQDRYCTETEQKQATKIVKKQPSKKPLRNYLIISQLEKRPIKWLSLFVTA
jgi:hypothetical protein